MSLAFHPGATEIEWLASLKTIAEQIGEEVFGRRVRWRVETGLTKSKNRSDVVVEFEGGSIILTGEAKRPDDPHGVSPLLTDEVDGAVAKAQHQGSIWCFTTNFHQIALFESGPGHMGRPLSRLQGNIVDLIPNSFAQSVGWWAVLTEDQRREATEPGLRTLFERVRLLEQGNRPRVAIDEVVVDFFSHVTSQILEPTWKSFIGGSARSDPSIQGRALTAGLDPNDDQQCRYLVAQAIFEVLTASLFYRVLQDHFSNLEPLLAGTTGRTAASLARVTTDSLSEAEALSGDYETILNLSEIGVWVLSNAPREALPHWRALLNFIDRLDVAEISSDVLGSIFERLISPERRHEMGQHYTQPRLARSMAKWGVRDRNDIVLDPACGAGTFLVETYGIHKSLGLSHDEILARTFGNDIDSFAVHLAAINLATKRIRHGLNHPLLRLGDAFELRQGLEMLRVHPRGGIEQEITLAEADLIIANPPYSRSHRDPDRALDQLRKLFGPTKPLPQTVGINFGAWFVLLGAGLLKSSGRMAFVLQSAVLQNENLESWRRWVRRRWNLVIWHTEEDVWFSDARVATCVILFSPRDPRARGPGSATFVNVLEPASGSLVMINGVPAPASQVDVRNISSAAPEEDLLVAGTKPAALLAFERAAHVARIKNIPEITTGAGQKLGHAFFRLKDSDPQSPAVVREVTGLHARFRINRSHLTPILASPKELTSGEPELTSTWLLTLPETLPASKAVHDYIALGKSRGVHEAPSVEARGKSWWSISPRLWDIAVPLNGQFRHEVVRLNPRGAVNNNFNALKVENPEDALLIGAALSSAFGALARLYISGELGCEGARRVLLAQFLEWPVLKPSSVGDPRLRSDCISAYAAWRKIDPSEIDEMSVAEAVAWRDLTIAVANAAMEKSSSSAQVIALADAAIREARATVARRRRREAAALAGRTRQSSGRSNALPARLRKWFARSPLVSRCVELLTSGPEVYRLRNVDDLEKLGLFGFDVPVAVSPAAERTLTETLGSGFEAAWPDPETQPAEFNATVAEITQLFATATKELVSEAPPEQSAARVTWNELADEMSILLRRHLQGAVREALQ